MFSRVWASGLSFNAPPGSANLTQLDINAAMALDGFGGGSYSPSALITIGGSGLTVAGPFNATDAEYISVDTTLQMEVGSILQLNGNLLANSGAIVGITSGAFLTVASGGTFTMNSGSTANIAATTTLSGTTTISGALTCSNTFTISGASQVNITPVRSYTRTCGAPIRYDSAKWAPPAALASAPITLGQAAAVTPGVFTEMLEYRAAVPETSILSSVRVRVKGSALLAGLPATLPTVRVIRTDTTTGAATVLATVTDPTLLLADYKLDHDIVAPVVVFVDRTKYEYLVYVEGDSGSGGVFSTEISSPRMIYTRGSIGEE